MKKIKTPIIINGFTLNKSKYDDVNIVKYIDTEEHPENKCVAIVDFIIRKTIYADNKEEIGKLINKELEKEVE